MYGSRFADLWASADPVQVKRAWAEGLAYVTAEQLQLALRDCLTEHPYPPSLPQFAILCRAHRPTVQYLPHVTNCAPVDPKIVAEVNELAAHMKGNKKHPKDWARRILKRVELGHKVPFYSVTCAKEALGIEPVC